MEITDGAGKSNSARVTDENALVTNAITIPQDVYASWKKGEYFILNMPRVTVTSGEGLVLWTKNSSTTKPVIVENIYWWWNGGSTNYNRPCYCRAESSTTQPTTNTTAWVAGQTNTLFSTTPELTVLYWNGTGTGMSGHISTGVNVISPIISQGLTEVNAGGKIILGPSASIGIYAQGVETGIFGFSVTFVQSTFSWSM